MVRFIDTANSLMTTVLGIPLSELDTRLEEEITTLCPNLNMYDPHLSDVVRDDAQQLFKCAPQETSEQEREAETRMLALLAYIGEA